MDLSQNFLSTTYQKRKDTKIENERVMTNSNRSVSPMATGYYSSWRENVLVNSLN